MRSILHVWSNNRRVVFHEPTRPLTTRKLLPQQHEEKYYLLQTSLLEINHIALNHWPSYNGCFETRRILTKFTVARSYVCKYMQLSMSVFIFVIFKTHPTRTKWPPFWQTTNSNAFSRMKKIELRFEFQRNLFRGVQLSISSGDGLAPNRRQAIIWPKADPVHWRIYVAPGRGGGLMS